MCVCPANREFTPVFSRGVRDRIEKKNPRGGDENCGTGVDTLDKLKIEKKNPRGGDENDALFFALASKIIEKKNPRGGDENDRFGYHSTSFSIEKKNPRGGDENFSSESFSR